MIVLAIETSCDETSSAIVKASGGIRNPQFEVLSNIVSSQVEFHAPYGGVVPTLAARKHKENLPRVFRLAFQHAKLRQRPQSIDLIAVTRGAGLAPALIQGVRFAKNLAMKWHKPIIGVNHLEGHIYSNFLNHKIVQKSKASNPISNHRILKIKFPIVCLVVSGGHTGLWLMKDYGRYRLLGQTRDDAAGECFDKGARLLNLEYPGGPEIDKLAKQGNEKSFEFPSPLLYSKDFDFSFSGLKTSLLYFLRDNNLNFSKRKLSRKQEQLRADIAAGFQKAIIRVLVEKTFKAAREYRAKAILVGGGVAANSRLKKMFSEKAKREQFVVPIIFPERVFITDNAAMIAAAGYFNYLLGRRDDPKTLDINANLQLG